LGDEERLLQLLSNLVANAFHHTPPDGVISVIADAQGDADVRIVVQDTGHGITSERVSQLFQRFVRHDGDRHRDGFGLGLAIVDQIVQLHDGTIRVKSQPGRGTTFIIELPSGLPGLVAVGSPIGSPEQGKLSQLHPAVTPVKVHVASSETD
jgi:signal transduction histidine kinase